jgi:hypothetical protein
MTDNPRLYLSKSLFMRGLQCPKSLYLDRYHPDLRDEISESRERVFGYGTELGAYARDLFPGGVLIPYEGLSHQEQVEMTLSEIKRGATTLYEAAFNHNGVFIKADILHKGKAGWELHEVKGSTQVKDLYLDDAAVQCYVIAGAGLTLTKVFLVYVNNKYVRQGPLEVQKFFLSDEITAPVQQKRADVEDRIRALREMLQGDTPAVDIGKQCSDPYDCDFHGYCWKHVPEYSVFRLGGSKSRMSELYGLGMLHLEDVPAHMLSGSQRLVLEAYLARQEFSKAEQVREFLDSLWYPLYFLDFETFSVPVPPFDGTWPYQHIPYQYSLHYLKDEHAELGHREFLAEPGADPRRRLAEELLSEIPDDACILAYNAAYEIRILGELAAYLPRRQQRIEAILTHVIDLAIPFRRKDVYHWQMMGSYSQKAVLPALIPGLSYDRLEVGDGSAAMEAYFRMCTCQDPEEISRIRDNLLEYCKLDTLGMVRLYEKLRQMG